ncbi:hypothetical protein DdX_21532 [Ditylenchus destructor]|uniref:Uncharacterized protein n=1 Tax=Ditylenchus destructor TaxID=166010 RepID=A0AAD4MES3_9BILA|nr:hypothetical protein DdX_21532 [Ditylenchus destructor]
MNDTQMNLLRCRKIWWCWSKVNVLRSSSWRQQKQRKSFCWWRWQACSGNVRPLGSAYRRSGNIGLLRTSSSSGSSWCSKPIGLLRFRRSGGGAASKPGTGGGSKPTPGTSVYFAAPSGGAGGAPGVTSCYFAPK